MTQRHDARPFGWTAVPVPVIGQGTWRIEGSAEAEQRSIDALRAGIDLGLTHIDTAEMYGERTGRRNHREGHRRPAR
jgi:diketogulonate reductase-like aldo/keto reductase